MTIHEYISKAKVTAQQIQECVLDFLRIRDDAVLIGAWAVNLYAIDADEEQRQTADIDLMTLNPNLQVELIGYVYANRGVWLTIHSSYPDLIRLYVKGMNNDKPLVDIVNGTAESETKDDLPVATIPWLVAAKKKAIASSTRPETKRLMDKRDLLVLEKAEERWQSKS